MEKTDLNGVNDIKKLIELRQEYFNVHNHILIVHKLLLHTETMFRDYFSVYSLRKDNVISGSDYAFLKHATTASDLKLYREYDIPLRIFFNLLTKEQERWRKLLRLSFEQYMAHKDMYDRLLYRDSQGESILSDDHYLAPLYNLEDITSIEQWAADHTVEEVLHTSSDTILFGDYVEFMPSDLDENTAAGGENLANNN